MAPGKLKALDSPDLYTIGWIAALPIERAAAAAMLDEEHAQPEGFSRNSNDKNSYTWGRIGDHYVVIASLPAGVHGIVPANATASSLLSSLPSIRLGLLVGIGGGIPRPNGDYDIRLGDVIVSQPDGTTGGVCQYDFVKVKSGNRRERKGFLAPPPNVLLHAVANIRSAHELRDPKIPSFLEEMRRQYPKMAKKTKQSPGYIHQGFANDKLFQPSYEHVSSQREGCQSCEVAQEVERDERESADPEIHYGVIASGNTLVKCGIARDRIIAEVGEECICFEMEAAGLMNEFPCLVIRGVCDYADSHKNDQWQRYASATAAAYAKELLAYVPEADVQKTKRASEILQSVDQKLGIVQQASEAVYAKVESIILSDRSQKLREWLAAPDPNTNANHARELRHEGTGTWLLETSTFQEWALGTNRHLWLRGMAGCGKTVLSTTVLDHLTKTDDRTILSFFFDFSDKTKQTKDSLLRSIALQLYQPGRSSVAAHLDDSFRTHQEGNLKPTTANLEELVDKLLTAEQRVVILLDALDESTTRDEIISWIKRIYESLSLVQMFYTSREEAEFMDVFPSTIRKECCLAIDKGATDMDVASYVSARLQTQPDFTRKRLSGDVLDQIRKKVGTGANGMFRWAACQLDSLAKSPSLDELEQQLDSLPLDLPDTYCRMLDSITPHYRERTMRLLQFLVFSDRPLTLKEGVEIFATEIQGEQPGFKPGRRLFNGNDILRHCNSLIALIDVEQGQYWREVTVPVQELHLAHFSVKEYLLVHEQIFNPRDASIAITKTLLTYLTDIPETFRRNGFQEDFPLASYAAKAWTSFAIIAEAFEDVSTIAVSFVQRKATLDKWIYLRNPFALGESYFYYACQFGLKAVAISIIKEGIDIDGGQHGPYGSPIQVASYYGYLEIFRLLIAANADVNVKGGKFGNALQAACCEGHTEIAKLLIKHNANIEAEGGKYGTALRAACSKGRLDIVRLLLKHNAHINAISKRSTALQGACFAGNIEIVQLLIKHNAYINAEGGANVTPLQVACRSGHIDIVRLLIKHNARINTRTGEYGNALVAASSGGHLKIVELLLSLQADINAGETSVGNALMVACKGGYDALVRLLLNKGADVQTPPGVIECPLMAACCQKHELVDIVQLLLDHGADVHFKGGKYGNPLQAAAFFGHKKIITLLLDRGADVNAPGGDFGSALQAACCPFHSDIEVVQLLIDQGADLNAQGGEWGSPLQAAYHFNEEAVFHFLVASGADVKALNTTDIESLLRSTIDRSSASQFRMLASLGEHSRLNASALSDLLQHACHKRFQEGIEALLNFGAKINARGGKYGSALHAACSNGAYYREQTVRFLLESGADVNTKHDKRGDVLQLACCRGNQSMVDMLINFGADVNAHGPGGTSAIHLASRNGHPSIVSTPLAREADANMIDKSGWTPLHEASWRGHDEVVTILLRNGSDLEAKERRGLTPIHLASVEGHEEAVKLLLDEGSNVEWTDNDGQTPLHRASCSGQEGVVKILLRNGANIESTTNDGQTPLHIASQKGRKEVVEVLVENGANIKPTDIDGHTPLYLAACEGYKEVAKLLIKNGANSGDRWKSFVLDSFHDHHRLVELLFKNGADDHSEETEEHPDFTHSLI